jgi:hypothetical protein
VPCYNRPWRARQCRGRHRPRRILGQG